MADQDLVLVRGQPLARVLDHVRPLAHAHGLFPALACPIHHRDQSLILDPGHDPGLIPDPGLTPDPGLIPGPSPGPGPDLGLNPPQDLDLYRDHDRHQALVQSLFLARHHEVASHFCSHAENTKDFMILGAPFFHGFQFLRKPLQSLVGHSSVPRYAFL